MTLILPDSPALKISSQIDDFRELIAQTTPNVLTVISSDVDEQAEHLKDWDQSYVQLSPGPFEGRLAEAWFGGIQFLRETTNQQIHELGSSWSGSHTFCIPLAMTGETWFRGMRWLPDTCATMGGNTDLDLHTGQTLDVIAVSLTGQRLAEMADQRQVSQAKLSHWLSSGCIAKIPPHSVAELRRMLLEIALLVENRSVLLDHTSVRTSIENAVYETVSNLIADSIEIEVPSPLYLPRRQLVRRAVEFVNAHPDNAVTVHDLCQLLRVSRRTLQEYFENVLHVSPLQYLRAFRLNRVRSALRNDSSLRVTDAAARFGFWHLSQFSHDYRRMFGESPSTTSSATRSKVDRVRIL
jgi:AraC family ethanolamine operon transcriptional activator